MAFHAPARFQPVVVLLELLSIVKFIFAEGPVLHISPRPPKPTSKKSPFGAVRRCEGAIGVYIRLFGWYIVNWRSVDMVSLASGISSKVLYELSCVQVFIASVLGALLCDSKAFDVMRTPVVSSQLLPPFLWKMPQSAAPETAFRVRHHGGRDPNSERLRNSMNRQVKNIRPIFFSHFLEGSAGP